MRFVDEYQPGWVQCEFEDAAGKRHTLVDKVPIFTCENLGPNSTYPKVGAVRCEELGRWLDPHAGELIHLSTANPDDIESAEGVSEFVVKAAQLSHQSADSE